MASKVAAKAADVFRLATRVRSLRQPLWSPGSESHRGNPSLALNWSLAGHDAAPVGVERVYRNLRPRDLVSHCEARYGPGFATALLEHENATRRANSPQPLPPASLRRVHKALVTDYLCNMFGTRRASQTTLYVLDGALGSNLDTCLFSRVLCDDPVVALALTHLMERLPTSVLDLDSFHPEVTAYVATGYQGSPDLELSTSSMMRPTEKEKKVASGASDRASLPSLAHISTDGTSAYIGSSVDLQHIRHTVAAAASVAIISSRRGTDPERYGLVLNGQPYPSGNVVLGMGSQQILWTPRGLARGWRDLLVLEEWQSTDANQQIRRRQWRERIAVSRWPRMASIPEDAKPVAIAPQRVPSTPNLMGGPRALYFALDTPATKRNSSDTNKKKRKPTHGDEQTEIGGQVIYLKDPSVVALCALATEAFPVPENLIELVLQDFMEACERANPQAVLVYGSNAAAYALELAAGTSLPDATSKTVSSECLRLAHQRTLERYPTIGPKLFAENGLLSGIAALTGS